VNAKFDADGVEWFKSRAPRLPGAHKRHPPLHHGGAPQGGVNLYPVTGFECMAEAMRSADAVGNPHGAATLGFLIRVLFAPPDSGLAPDPKPSLRIV
jgi:hypothetical protein